MGKGPSGNSQVGKETLSNLPRGQEEEGKQGGEREKGTGEGSEDERAGETNRLEIIVVKGRTKEVRLMAGRGCKRCRVARAVLRGAHTQPSSIKQSNGVTMGGYQAEDHLRDCSQAKTHKPKRKKKTK